MKNILAKLMMKVCVLLFDLYYILMIKLLQQNIRTIVFQL